MALPQSVHTTLESAAEAAHLAFVNLRNGALPLTVLQMDSRGHSRMRVVGDGTRLGTREQRQALLKKSAPGTVITLILFSAAARYPDSHCTHALHLEFGLGPALLEDLVVLLPYTPSDAGKTPVAGMLRAAEWSESTRPLLDAIVQALCALLLNMGHGEWESAIKYDKPGQPSQAEFEARDLPLPLLCPSLDPHDSAPGSANEWSPDCDEGINALLDALIERYPFTDGIAFRSALYQLALDFTVESLLRVDDALGQLGRNLGMGQEAFLRRQANLNFVHVVAAYCGKVVAKASASWVNWYTPAQWQRQHPDRPLPARPYPMLVAQYNGGTQAQPPFLPMDLVLGRLFGQLTSTQFRAELMALAKAVQETRPRLINDEMPQIQHLIDTLPAGAPGDYLSVLRPSWADTDPFGAWFDNYPVLLKGGRVVWGVTVQANSLIFSTGTSDCPGQVLYDPQGILPPQMLQQVAGRLAATKSCRLHDPRLAFFSDFLTEEYTRTFALRMPYLLSSDDVCTSSIQFVRKHLQGGRLWQRFYPLLVHDAAPGIVAVLPRRLWTPGLIEMMDDLRWRGQHD